MRRCILLSCGLDRWTCEPGQYIGHSFPGTGFGSPSLLLVPAKKDPNPGKLELRL